MNSGLGRVAETVVFHSERLHSHCEPRRRENRGGKGNRANYAQSRWYSGLARTFLAAFSRRTSNYSTVAANRSRVSHRGIAVIHGDYFLLLS